MNYVISDIITKTFDTMDEIFTSFVVMRPGRCIRKFGGKSGG